MPAPLVMIDASREDCVLCFEEPVAIISARVSQDLPSAMKEMDAALAEGRYLAGWCAYDMGYALEPRLAPLLRSRPQLPLLWFGAYEAPKRLARNAIRTNTRAYASPLRHGWSQDAYREHFVSVKDFIAQGDIYQANLSFRSTFRLIGDPLAVYVSLRERVAASHCAYVDTGTCQILSLSPELFFRITADGTIVARPMKGTAPRGDGVMEDLEQVRRLRESDKERAENLMIVDLLRNDLGRIAESGSVRVQELFATETYPTFHTMVSTVEARLKPATRLSSVLAALFPCGSVTGAPKIRAMEIIRELEPDPRGIYCGAVGIAAPDGSAEFNVAIRTILVDQNEGTLGLGGAVVQDSTAVGEYAECLLKARFFEVARRPMELIETLRWDGGFVRLDRHLERMERSAVFLGLPFDRSALVETLSSAVTGLYGPHRVRFTLHENGRFAFSISQLSAARGCWKFAISPMRVNSQDPLLRHKTSWREIYDGERDRVAGTTGADEVLFLNERSELTEGSRTNLFLKRDGRLYTPLLSCGLLDGVLRQTLLDEGECKEAIMGPHELATADAVFLGNSLRGLIPACPAND